VFDLQRTGDKSREVVGRNLAKSNAGLALILSILLNREDAKEEGGINYLLSGRKYVFNHWYQLKLSARQSACQPASPPVRQSASPPVRQGMNSLSNS
jgi:hypothetical protein